MISIISSAHAADVPAAAQQGNGFLEIGILIFFFAVFYMLIWRPQAKRAKEHRNLISSLSKGDEVVMSSGMLGRITDLDDQYVVLAPSEGLSLRFQRQAVAQVLPKGTLKSL